MQYPAIALSLITKTEAKDVTLTYVTQKWSQ